MNFIRELYENNKKQFHIGILLLILLILLIVIHTMTKKDNPEKENNTTRTETTADSSGTEVDSGIRFLPGHRIPETPNLRP